MYVWCETGVENHEKERFPNAVLSNIFILEARRSAVKKSSMSAFEWDDIRGDGSELADYTIGDEWSQRNCVDGAEKHGTLSKGTSQGNGMNGFRANRRIGGLLDFGTCF